MIENIFSISSTCFHCRNNETNTIKFELSCFLHRRLSPFSNVQHTNQNRHTLSPSCADMAICVTCAPHLSLPPYSHLPCCQLKAASQQLAPRRSGGGKQKARGEWKWVGGQTWRWAQKQDRTQATSSGVPLKLYLYADLVDADTLRQFSRLRACALKWLVGSRKGRICQDRWHLILIVLNSDVLGHLTVLTFETMKNWRVH